MLPVIYRRLLYRRLLVSAVECVASFGCLFISCGTYNKTQQLKCNWVLTSMDGYLQYFWYHERMSHEHEPRQRRSMQLQIC